jgi:hypothetical protein
VGIEELFFFKGVFSSLFFNSVLPLILITLVGFVIALELIVTLLLNAPTLFVSYFTFITLESPGKIGSLGQTGTVQPQLPFAFDIIKGALPEFVNLNS